MVLTLIKQDRIYTTYLPNEIKGQFWVRDISRNQNRRLLSVEAGQGLWIIRGSRQAQLALSAKPGTEQKRKRESQAAVVENGGFYQVVIAGEVAPSILFAEELTDQRLRFEKYVVTAQQGINITIGRNPENHICYNNPNVSGVHATLQYFHGKWSIQDQKSKNGTFVNQQAIKSSPLALGDTIYILGLSIIIGGDFLAINNPNQRIAIDQRILQPYQPEPITEDEAGDQTVDQTEPNYFYRSPRFRREIQKATFQIDAPPQANQKDDTPLALMLGPSITMGMASVTMGYFSVSNALSNGDITAALPSIAMSVSMLLGTILWPILTRRHEKKKRKKQELQRNEKYREYLEDIRKQIQAECAAQEDILRENAVTAMECANRIAKRGSRLWERTADQPDFLVFRVGIGVGVLKADVRYAEKRFELEEDNLRQIMYELCEQGKPLNNIPITISLLDDYLTAVVGRREKCLAFADDLLLQLAGLYGYDEVKTVFLYDEAERERFGFAKWLPHAWEDDKQFRLIASNLEELKALSSHMEKEIEQRSGLQEQQLARVRPYYVIFAFSRELALRAEMLRQIYAESRNIRISVVCFFDDLKNVPKEVSKVIDLRTKEGRIFDKNDTSGIQQLFTCDASAGSNMRDIALSLANTTLDLGEGSYQLPSMLTFLEMFEAESVERLNAQLRWKEHDSTKSLQTMVGVNTFGDRFTLDLHEAFQGPHGLVAGMTGSGKSEFIITYILSLAVNYHPDDVAFLLIDYKGGGMAESFKKLPHTAGIITNLDGAAIRRSLVSLESELKRRQGILKKANEILDTSNIDIYKYQRAYHDGQVSDPLPHLFIISDEFAELRTQQQEFMEKLISAARIGRSLGVHLILATQKPAGVVDEQIWSNSRFRVCLKVQDRQDSMDMLKRPDAAELKATGRFYLQVGYNELFEMGQSAWAGAPYRVADGQEAQEDCAVTLIDRNAAVLRKVKYERPLTEEEKKKKKKEKKQLNIVVDYLSQVSAEQGIKPLKLWREPIPAAIALPDLERKYVKDTEEDYILNPLIGEVDDPENQDQFALYLPFSAQGNAIIYGSSGAGKTTLLTTMLYSLLCSHTADTLNAYLMDFGSETLRQFESAPQVGDVMLSNDTEKIPNTFLMLRTEIARRKKLFSDFGGDYASYCRSTGKREPNLLLVINGYSAFSELYNDQEENVSYIAMEGTKYGIYIILTAATTNAVRYRIAQNFKQLLVLQLNDDSEYSSVLGSVGGLYPARLKGRGILKLDKIYEFQTAHIAIVPPDEGEKEEQPKIDPALIQADINALCETLSADLEQPQAKRVPILPESVDADFLADRPVTLQRFPVGVNKQSMEVETVNLQAIPVTVVLGSDEDLIGSFAQGMAALLAQRLSLPITLLDGGSELEAPVVELFNLLVDRHKRYKANPEESFDTQVYIITSISSLLKSLSPDGADKVANLLKFCRPEYNVRIILCDSDDNAFRRYSSDEWYSMHFKGDGLWLGGGFNSQYVYSVRKKGPDLAAMAEDDLGVLLRKGRYKIIKPLQAQPEAMEDDDDA